MTEKHKRAIREAVDSAKIRHKMSESHKGRTLEEMGHKLDCNCGVCKAKRGEYFGDNNPAKRDGVGKKISDSLTGKLHSKKRKERQKEVQNRPETKKKKPEKIKSLWQDSGYILNQSIGRKRGNVLPNKVEIKLFNLLQELLPGEWQYTGDWKNLNGGFGRRCPDFVHTSKKLIIELFGDYWHSEEKTGVPKEEHMFERINYFKECGYKTLILWESDFQNPEFLKKSIIYFVGNKRPTIYYSHPMRGKKGNTLKGNSDHEYQNRNSENAILNVSWLRNMFPQIDFYCPGEVELPVQTAYKLGFLFVKQILTIDCTVIERHCSGILAHRWESSEGLKLELEEAKKLGYPTMVCSKSKFIWECDQSQIQELVGLVLRFHEAMQQ